MRERPGVSPDRSIKGEALCLRILLKLRKSVIA